MEKARDKQEPTPIEKHPNYQKIMDAIARLSPEERDEMLDFCNKYLMQDKQDTPEK